MRLRTFLILLLFVAGLEGFGQSKIIDDTTRQVYGPYTTLYQTFEDIKYNKDNLRKIDTLITDLHSFTFVNKLNNEYQNLGNLGTALKPIFYTPPENVGIRSGYDAYEQYYISAEDIPFFDTKSPYTLVDAVIGAKGRAVTNVKHTRNITPYWNFGAHYRSVVADKQVASTGRGDRQVSSTAYYIHSHYQSKQGKYLGLISLSRINHKVEENGGIVIPEGDPRSSYFDDNADIRLQNAESQDFRLGLHIYNQYKLAKELQFYHSFQQITNRNFYTDNPLSTDYEYYDQVLIDPDSTTDQSQTSQLINEAGIKGDLANMFYNFYIKARRVGYQQRYIAGKEVFNEQSAGFNLRYDFDSLQYVHASGEYLIDGNFRIGGKYFMKFLTVEYWKSRYKPSIISETYFGNHYEWYNDFGSTGSDYLKGSIAYEHNGFRIEPFASAADIRNNVVYGFDKRPVQIDGAARILSAGLNLDLKFLKSIYFKNEVIFTHVTGDSAAANGFRIPKLFVNSKLYFGNKIFKKTVYVEMGVDTHFKSDYFANAYDPITQQFYLQDDFEVTSYVVADLFLDFQIGHVSIFLKLAHINQPNEDGYFTMPYYTGPRKGLDFGVRWLFFD